MQQDNFITFFEPVALSSLQYATTLYDTQYITSMYINFEIGTHILASDDFIASAYELRLPTYGGFYDFNDYMLPLNPNGRFSFEFSPRTPALTIDKTAVIEYRLPVSEFLPFTGTGHTPDSVYFIGDSITQGAHTSGYSLGTDPTDFRALISETLSSLGATTASYAEGGGTVEWLTANLASVVASEHDTIVIGYGMNGHTRGPEGLEDWENQLHTAANALTVGGKEVVLLGFFEQNPQWERENQSDTLLYNAAIERVADQNENVRFVDIYTIFKQWESVKDLEFELLGDGLHHPNNFGHMIYYNAILPLLLDQGVVYDSVLMADIFESMEDFAFGENLRGDNDQNTLVGTGADEFLFGFDGDDILIGGGGSDVFDGGMGNDVAQLGVDFSQVVFGISADLTTLLLHVDGAEMVGPDNLFTVRSNVEQIQFSQGITGTLVMGEGVLSQVETTDSAGRLLSLLQIDYGNLTSWSSLESRFAENGELTGTITILDTGLWYATDLVDGAKTRQMFEDKSDLYGWSSIERLFNTDGNMTRQNVVNDDGSHNFSETYSSGRQVSVQFGTNGEAQRRVISDGELSLNAEIWDQIEFIYFEAGGVHRISTLYDDGNLYQVHYDQAGQKTFADYIDQSDMFDWEVRRSYFDADGELTTITYTMDDILL